MTSDLALLSPPGVTVAFFGQSLSCFGDFSNRALSFTILGFRRMETPRFGLVELGETLVTCGVTGNLVESTVSSPLERHGSIRPASCVDFCGVSTILSRFILMEPPELWNLSLSCCSESSASFLVLDLEPVCNFA